MRIPSSITETQKTSCSLFELVARSLWHPHGAEGEVLAICKDGRQLLASIWPENSSIILGSIEAKGFPSGLHAGLVAFENSVKATNAATISGALELAFILGLACPELLPSRAVQTEEQNP
jgi:hypothetical protein